MKLSTFVSALAWASVFSLSWMMIMNKVPASTPAWVFFGFFTLVGVLAGIMSTNRIVR